MKKHQSIAILVDCLSVGAMSLLRNSPSNFDLKSILLLQH